MAHGDHLGIDGGRRHPHSDLWCGLFERKRQQPRSALRYSDRILGRPKPIMSFHRPISVRDTLGRGFFLRVDDNLFCRFPVPSRGKRTRCTPWTVAFCVAFRISSRASCGSSVVAEVQTAHEVKANQDPQTQNRYAYVRNNPLSFVDPSGGLLPRGLTAAVVAAAVHSIPSVAAATPSIPSAFHPSAVVVVAAEVAVAVAAKSREHSHGRSYRWDSSSR